MFKKNILAVFFCLGILVLGFIAGAASLYYNVPRIANFFTQGFTGVSVWVDTVKADALPRCCRFCR
jgi:hypothetical protein